jgi:predicted N-formylglutamate amidohydrolase
MASLLGPDDPQPFSVFHGDATAPLLLLCDHASRVVPRSLDQLGLSDEELARHIGWDIGAAAAALLLADAFQARLVTSGYSRLVIDCNRKPGYSSSIPPISDGTVVPGNRELSDADRAARAEACFWPYHRAIDNQLAALMQGGVKPALVVIHSFTPRMSEFDRPWQLGILWDDDPRLALPLLEHLGRQKDVVVGDNEPYSGRGEQEYTIGAHARPHDLPRVSIEIRQDLIADDAGVRHWARVLQPALAAAFEAAGLAIPTR